MTVLPIVERELRVAARRKGTYWSRLVAALLALFIFAGFITITTLGNQGWGSQIGPILFGVFSWLSFAFACAAGVFLTSDCLSEEKREGTLGLLFLTTCAATTWCWASCSPVRWSPSMVCSQRSPSSAWHSCSAA